LQVAQGAAYLFPDLMAICRGFQYADGPKDTLTNPTVIVEVLSDFTERSDREGKSARYRQVDPLREYVLFAQDEMSIKCYTRRRDDGEWGYHAASGLDGTLHLYSLNVSLPLAEIYSKIDQTERDRSGQTLLHRHQNSWCKEWPQIPPKRNRPVTLLLHNLDTLLRC
jgi:Uma2 family endonuclease